MRENFSICRASLSIAGYLATLGPLYPKSKKCLLPPSYLGNFPQLPNNREPLHYILKTGTYLQKYQEKIQEFIHYHLRRSSLPASYLLKMLHTRGDMILQRNKKYNPHETTQERLETLTKVHFSPKNLTPILSSYAHEEGPE